MEAKSYSNSFWSQNLKLPHFPSLQKDEKADVCIIGGGIAGLSCAYNLLKSGKSVVLLEMDSIGSKETSKTTSHLTSILDERYYKLEDLFPEHVQAIAESHIKAIDTIEALCKHEKIHCDFKRVDGFLFLSEKDELETLEKEFAALKRLGFKTAELLEEGPIPHLGPCIRIPGQGEMHPLKYLIGLSKAVFEKGGKIFTKTKAVSFQTAGMPIKTITSEGRLVESDYLIVATNTPIDDRLIMHTKQTAYRSYAIAGWIPKNALPEALFWDTDDPYHYIRLYKDPFNQLEDLLIIGGEDHKTGRIPKANPYEALENWAKEKFPLLDKPSFCWSGQIIEPVDTIAYIGKNPLDNSNVFIATGASGNGLTYGVIAGALLSDLILNKQNPLENAYSPKRKPIKKLIDFLKENLNVLGQYLKWLMPFKSASKSTFSRMKKNSGIVLQDGLKKSAYYKDHEGNLHKFSGKCTHLDGLVNWNDLEKSWDCPCHGSRYDCFGKLVNGPAIKDLEKH